MKKKTTTSADRVWPDRVRFKPRKSHHYLLQALEGLNTEEIGYELLSLANTGAMVMMGIMPLGAPIPNGTAQDGSMPAAARNSSPSSPSRIGQLNDAFKVLEEPRSH